MLIFFLGVLLGVLFGSLLCAAYLRQEIAAGVSPKLKRVELQLETIESQLALALLARQAELHASLLAGAPRPTPGRDDYQVS